MFDTIAINNNTCDAIWSIFLPVYTRITMFTLDGPFYHAHMPSQCSLHSNTTQPIVLVLFVGITGVFQQNVSTWNWNGAHNIQYHIHISIWLIHLMFCKFFHVFSNYTAAHFVTVCFVIPAVCPVIRFLQSSLLIIRIILKSSSNYGYQQSQPIQVIIGW